MAQASTYGAQAARDFAGAREPAGLATAVVRFHRHLDEVLAASHRGHGTALACRAGCSLCCSMRVEVQPAEAFALAEFLRRRLDAARLQQVLARLEDNVARTRALTVEQRKRTNIACALLEPDGRCGAYEARPAHCRRFHSSDLGTCQASHDRPEDDAIESPMHPAVAHNGAVIMRQAQQAIEAAGLDAAYADLNLALREALLNPKSARRWRDGKKAFP